MNTALELDGTLYHSISVDTKVMVSKNCPIIGEHVAVNFVAQKVTIATILPVKTPLILALSAYNSKTSSVTPIEL